MGPSDAGCNVSSRRFANNARRSGDVRGSVRIGVPQRAAGGEPAARDRRSSLRHLGSKRGGPSPCEVVLVLLLVVDWIRVPLPIGEAGGVRIAALRTRRGPLQGCPRRRDLSDALDGPRAARIVPFVEER